MTLADEQRALIDALVGGGAIPEGFAAAGVRATRIALRRKRAGEVARAWPFLAAAYGDRWTATFAAWADGRPPQGSLRDGWDFARSVRDTLPPLARDELAEREAAFAYDGAAAPVPRGRVAAWLRRRAGGRH
ncbi:hypothetical protein Daura_09735 [Dactylosporangium aurantiacum]|uniref:SCO6045-like C-terminal domain-containing protein n=1 Tax=Dactylosporangium aurantiacum TaxID=35754 RepID=A0A9Q9MH73_9ACTN|nr:hypothetical protein [Dactylosporangium aurantiacum]MDG6109315.1 hypothetical protein [Dactylosporangium aurantiacum]UWZ56424.1 hypothetical protein Daura_09735 [Dactylosporangium aurantiacum]